MEFTYGVPLWLMKAYLAELGAEEVAENVMEADHWRAVVSQAEPAKIGSLVVGRIQVNFSGDETAIEPILEKLELKTFRAGG